jgi:hypothetical protein
MNSYINRYAETLGDGTGRAIMRIDTVIDGELVPELSGTEGSPASIETVRRHESRLVLS